MKSRYGRNDNMIPKITDSAIWRRICSADALGSELCTMDQTGKISWNEENDGQFSIKSAYEEVRDLDFNYPVYQQIWEAKTEIKMKILQWKIVKGILPTADNLSRFHFVLNPSMCPLCRCHSDSMKHLFYQCQVAKEVWRYFFSIFGIYQPPGVDYSHLHYWKLRNGPISLVDFFKQSLPGIICWTIWKEYTNHIWGSGGGISNPNYIILQVKMYTQSWVATLPTHKIRITGDILFQEGLIHKHFCLQCYKPQIIKWQLPVKKWKINVDAGYLAGKARGGAVLRDRRGGFVMAICFPVCATSSLETELKAILSATRWAMEEGLADFSGGIRFYVGYGVYCGQEEE
ncbi:unnamed protein product [Cuscuta europaea]|uniref:Reverse transcriptase zinc-binding domain-containing protein n=1 Tax=Cuscuta europaea TaxID=41803 RepID=A0A9P0YKH5_CUSEU|nr:unnamed protein product [Cuscuta europaea]